MGPGSALPNASTSLKSSSSIQRYFFTTSPWTRGIEDGPPPYPNMPTRKKAKKICNNRFILSTSLLVYVNERGKRCDAPERSPSTPAASHGKRTALPDNGYERDSPKVDPKDWEDPLLTECVPAFFREPGGGS